MRFLRALLNSGVFMIILLAAATLYLVYSDAIKREHGIVDAANETLSPVAEVPAAPATSVAAQEASAVVPAQEASVVVPAEQTPVAPVTAQEPIQAEPAFETQPPAQARSDMPPMMPYQAMMPMPEQAPIMSMPMPEPMPPMMQQEAPMAPAYQPQMSVPIPQSNVEKARAALYEGNLEVAQQAYQAELSAVNDPDLHGELGNVFFAQQNWQAAAVEYAAAVEGLSAQGRFLQAQYVLGFLMQIDPDMGQKAMANLRAQMYPRTN